MSCSPVKGLPHYHDEDEEQPRKRKKNSKKFEPGPGKRESREWANTKLNRDFFPIKMDLYETNPILEDNIYVTSLKLCELSPLVERTGRQR